MIGKERKFEDNSKYINHNIVKGESEGRTHIDDVRQHQRRSEYCTFVNKVYIVDARRANEAE